MINRIYQLLMNHQDQLIIETNISRIYPDFVLKSIFHQNSLSKILSILIKNKINYKLITSDSDLIKIIIYRTGVDIKLGGN